jgi:hypothetical protein
MLVLHFHDAPSAKCFTKILRPVDLSISLAATLRAAKESFAMHGKWSSHA